MGKAPVVVWQMKPVWGLPNASPFCMKLEVWLRLAGIEHRLETLTRPPRTKSGKVPFIERADGTFLSDTSTIIETLRQEFTIELDAHLTPEQQSLSLFIRRTLEEHLYWVTVYERWLINSAWAATKVAYFGDLAPILRTLVPALIRRKVARDAWGQGIARLPHHEILARADKDLRALDATLGDNPFFFGERPTSVDATAYAFLANMFVADVPCESRRLLLELPRLVNYIERMKARVYPAIGS